MVVEGDLIHALDETNGWTWEKQRINHFSRLNVCLSLYIM